MNANEPLMGCRYEEMLSKPGNERISGMSSDVIWTTGEAAAGIQVA